MSQVTAVVVSSLLGSKPLATGHQQKHVSQNLRIQQRTMQVSLGIIDIVTFAQRVQVVLLTRMFLPCYIKAVRYLTKSSNLPMLGSSLRISALRNAISKGAL